MASTSPLPPSVLKENTYAVALSKEQVKTYCNFCIARLTDLKRCSACKTIVYCSAECQRIDWKQHKYECRTIVENGGEVPDDGVRLVMRIAALQESGNIGEIKDDYIPSGGRSLETMASHDSDMEDEANVYLQQYLQVVKKPVFNEKKIKEIFKKVSINSFALNNQVGSSIGIALCIKLSVANHSCKPATRVVFNNRIAMLVPTSNRIPTSLETATHSYIDELQPVAIRRDILRQKYKFECECEGCCDEVRNAKMEAWTCGICVDGWMRNNELSKCELCNWKMTRDHYETCRLAESAGLNARATLQRDDLQVHIRLNLCEKMMNLFADTLHKNNVIRLPMLRVLYGIALYKKNISEAEKYGIQLLNIMEEYQEPKDMAILFHKFGLAQVMIAGGAMESAKELLEAIKKDYIDIYGENSHVVNNIRAMLEKTRL